jgi:hypothetical protein
VFVFACPHVPLFNDEPEVAADDRQGHVEPLEVVLLRVEVHLARIGAVFLDVFVPLLRHWVESVAVDHVEAGKGITQVKNNSSFVPEKRDPLLAVRVADPSADVLVEGVAVEVVNGDAKHPAEQDLVVGVHAIIQATDRDQENYHDGHEEADDLPAGAGSVPTAQQIPHCEIKSC